MKKHLILITLHLASCASDYYFTNRNAHNPRGNFRESDPLARPFVTHGDGLRAFYFVGTSAATLEFAHFLHKRGYGGERAADFVLTQQILDNSVNAVRSAEGYKK